MDRQSQFFADFCRKSGVVYNNANFRVLWDYIKNVQYPEMPANSIIHTNVYAAAYLDVKDRLEFEPPPPVPPTEKELRAERERRLEATNNIGPLSARSDPRRTDDPTGGIGTLKEFVDKAISNLDKASRGEVPPQKNTQKVRTIPADITPEALRDGDYTSAEIRDYLARRKK